MISTVGLQYAKAIFDLACEKSLEDVYFENLKLINSLIDGNLDSIVNIINTIYNDGIDLKLFVDQFLSFILDISKYIICQAVL